MAQSKIDDEGAFDLLRRASQRLNIKLVDVAEKVIHPGEAHDPVPPELLP
jgi:AmiR/NasT family two-component response regulator